MAKTAAAAETPATKTYHVKPGVAVVNGLKVGDRKTVDLTDREAMFDLAQGRISDKPFPTGKSGD